MAAQVSKVANQGVDGSCETLARGFEFAALVSIEDAGIVAR